MTWRAVEITWPAGVSVPVLPGQVVTRCADGGLTVAYTTDHLRAVIALMKSMRGERWTAAETEAYARVKAALTEEAEQGRR